MSCQQPTLWDNITAVVCIALIVLGYYLVQKYVVLPWQKRIIAKAERDGSVSGDHANTKPNGS